MHTAPAPDDVNWPALWLGWRPRVLRTVAAVLPIAAIMIFPIGIFTGAKGRVLGFRVHEQVWICGWIPAAVLPAVGERALLQ